MMPAMDGDDWRRDDVLATVRRYWGFEGLRPLQEEAIRAGLEHRDSLVVLPTGGGKSLCYQVPPAVARRTDVVVSPLIALMKDQVDGLRACGYPAAALHGGMDPGSIRTAEREIAAGRHHLVFVAPERLLTPRFLELAARLGVASFAIDEAHCISQWGHDFRPEYRQLAGLRENFPAASLHAYTATATERVRTDIVAQLRLADPRVLVGSFDRPNLVYRVAPRSDLRAQVLDVLGRHRGEAAIVYCLSRRDAEEMAERLSAQSLRAAHYHAGMEPGERRRTQDRFAAEEIDVVAATVAFGMGIDRSDVRCVVHAATPKSIEHYQQETGRAGRDGLPAECVLFYSPADVLRWHSLMERAQDGAPIDPGAVQTAKRLLEEMRRFATSARCRHAALSAYFGQPLAERACGACDVCLGEVEGLVDATVLAQKILSCVARTEQGFGITHVADVLVGADSDAVRRWGHDRLSTHGLLRDLPRKTVVNVIYQMIDAGVLERTTSDRPTLTLNAASWEVMRGRRTVELPELRRRKAAKTRLEESAWRDVDEGLFESLRALRREIAAERGVPAYVILHDATLRDLARLRPGSVERLRGVRGLGEKKLADLGPRVIEHIVAYVSGAPGAPRHRG
ncbi:MAG: RecQ family ATP-dependent DNA helicase [Deltaproteobacteria bacterium]|nr:RecQ family ATP-dependent DNA helicase [Deltaproteobacteria bacterium]